MVNDVLNIVNSNTSVQAISYKDMKTLQQKYEVLIKNRILVKKTISSSSMPVNENTTPQKRRLFKEKRSRKVAQKNLIYTDKEEMENIFIDLLRQT